MAFGDCIEGLVFLLLLIHLLAQFGGQVMVQANVTFGGKPSNWAVAKGVVKKSTTAIRHGRYLTILYPLLLSLSASLFAQLFYMRIALSLFLPMFLFRTIFNV
jgi:hypothetical protein